MDGDVAAEGMVQLDMSAADAEEELLYQARNGCAHNVQELLMKRELGVLHFDINCKGKEQIRESAAGPEQLVCTWIGWVGTLVTKRWQLYSSSM